VTWLGNNSPLSAAYEIRFQSSALANPGWSGSSSSEYSLLSGPMRPCTTASSMFPVDAPRSLRSDKDPALVLLQLLYKTDVGFRDRTRNRGVAFRCGGRNDQLLRRHCCARFGPNSVDVRTHPSSGLRSLALNLAGPSVRLQLSRALHCFGAVVRALTMSSQAYVRRNTCGLSREEHS
jgi:hypothetical protein